MEARAWVRLAATGMVVVLAAALMWVGYRRYAAERPPAGLDGLGLLAPVGLAEAGLLQLAHLEPPSLEPGGVERGANKHPAPPLVVHVTGAVVNPGVYALELGDRVADAVRAAGGARPDGLPHALNLAVPLADGDKIYVPRVADLAGGGPVTVPPEAQGTNHGPVGATADSATARPGGRINLNTAKAAELESIPGIGPALAQRILEVRRRQGRFQRVEDLLEVPGIGQKKLDQMREHMSL